MQLKKFDALAALIAAATGLALAEDCSRTEIVTAQATSVIEATASETCAQAEYRRRALRVSVILTGGMPDADWRGPDEIRSLRRGSTSEAGAPL